MTKRRITCLCLAVLLLLPMLFTGCGKEVEKALASYTENSMARIGDTIVAQNSKYMLIWAESRQGFVLRDNATGAQYTGLGLGGTGDNSPLIVEYYDAENPAIITTQQANASICWDQETFSAEKIDNGVRVVFSLAEERIAVTVEYLLRDNGIEIRIPIDGLQEENLRIYEIKLAPFFASVVNNTGSYLMVPSGSGALIKAQTSLESQSYYESVYGSDVAAPVNFRKRVQDQIYLPVFGAMNVPDGGAASTGMVGVIEQGAECALINAQTGGMNAAYSTVYPSFCIRSTEKVVYNSQGGAKQTGVRYSDSVVDLDYLSVYYMPRHAEKGDDVTYNGMADCYRSYLQSNGYLQNKAENAPALSINMLGATQTTKSLFGIPYQSDVAVTDLEQTKAIVAELNDMLAGKKMLVTLEGYGKGGLANTVVGGGFKLSKEVGKKKDLAALVSYAADNGIVLSMDYELAQFQGNGSGIRTGRDSAMLISSLKAKVGTHNINTGLLEEKGLFWYLTARAKLITLMDKVLNAVSKNNVSAISLGSLNRIAYSDFRTEGYAAMSDMGNDVAYMLNQASENGLYVVADRANDYVALNADYVTEVPMDSTAFNVFSEEIPFYAMVFQGYVPLTSSSINLAVDPTDAYLKAVATGMGLQFTLCDTLHESSLWDEDTAFVSCRYVDWKDRIAEMVNESAALHEKVGNQSITLYEQLGALSFTTFANGVKVVVNYSEEAVTYNNNVIEANSFIVL